MRRIVLVFCLLTAFLSRADYWDNLSRAEAEMVVAELRTNPFIFQYCDCCGNTLQLVEVLSSEIVPCSWLEGAFSVRYTFKALAAFTREGTKPDQMQAPSGEETSDLVYMNYTWTLDPESGHAAPFFRAIPYSYYENTLCAEPFAFPSPKRIKAYIKGTGYKQWYAQAIGAR